MRLSLRSKIVSILAIVFLSLSFSSPASWAAGSDSTEPKTFSNIPFLGGQPPLDSQNGQPVDVPGWFPDPAQTIDNLLSLYEEGRAFAKHEHERLGADEFNKALNEGRMQIHRPEGAVEFTLIDSVPTARIIHEPTGTAYIFLDADHISKDSPHLAQYIARQHHFAGTTRRDGIKGRDAVLVWLQDHNIKNVELSEKPRMFTRQYWKEYWRGVYKKPTRDTAIFGVACGILQTGVGLAVSALKVHFDPSAEFLIEPAVLNFIFGTSIGTYVSTYRNWVTNGSNSIIGQSIRSSTVSVTFAYTLAFTTGQSVSFMDTAGLLTNLALWTNIMGNNWSKTEWTQWAKIKERERADTKVYNIPLPYISLEESKSHSQDSLGATEEERPSSSKLKLKTYDWALSQRNINHQIYAYLPPQFLRTADLVGITLSLPILGAPLPIGTIALWSSIPIVKYSTLKWAEKYYPQSAEDLQLRKTWNDFLKSPLRLPKKLYTVSRDYMRKIWHYGTEQRKVSKFPGNMTRSQYKKSISDYNKNVVASLSERQNTHPIVRNCSGLFSGPTK